MPVDTKTIPPNALKPGVYAELNTLSGVTGLPADTPILLLLGQMLATATLAVNTPVQVYSAAEVADKTGSGSILHRMALAAFAVDQNLPVWICGQADAGSATASTATLTFTGTSATVAGELLLWVGDDLVDIAIPVAATPTIAAAAVAAAVNANTKLSVTASAALGVVTFTSKNKGTVGLQLALNYQLLQATGLTVAVTAFAGGTLDPDMQALLDAAFPKRFHVIASWSAASGDLAKLKTHLDTVSNAMEQRPGRGVAALTTGAAAAAVTLAQGVNHERVHVAYLPGTFTPGYEVAATLAAIMADEPDPALPFNGMVLPAVNAPPIASRLARSVQETLLAGGVTPLEVDGVDVKVVRLVTTRTTTSGASDLTLLDTGTMACLDYFRNAVVTRLKVKFGRAKLTDAVLASIVDQTIDVAKRLEVLGILQKVDDFKAQFQCIRDPNMPGRARLQVPSPIVPGLHQIYARFDLITI